MNSTAKKAAHTKLRVLKNSKLQTLTAQYKVISSKLEAMAEIIYDNEEQIKESTVLERALLEKQTDIINQASKQAITSLDDVKAALTLWTCEAAETTDEAFMNPPDRLILSISKYLNDQ